MSQERVIDIFNRTVKELWGWAPSGRDVLTPQKQCEMIAAELSYAFKSRGMKANSIDAHLHRDGSGRLVVECIVDGIVQISTYDAHPNHFDMQAGNDGDL